MKPSLQRIDEKSGRYLPIIYPEELPFWEGLRARKLKLQRCGECGKAWFPIGPLCLHCLSMGFSWTPLSGKGVVHNFVVYHKAWMAWFESRVPYAVVQVQLDEGPRLTTNMTDTPWDRIRKSLIKGASPLENPLKSEHSEQEKRLVQSFLSIGMPVEAIYEDVTDEITLLHFKAADRAATL